MDMDLLKNGSGIKDPTAYKAIKSLEGDNVKEFTSKLKKCDICEYTLSSGTIKKCVVVSDGQTGMFIPIIVLTDELNSSLVFRFLWKMMLMRFVLRCMQISTF